LKLLLGEGQVVRQRLLDPDGRGAGEYAVKHFSVGVRRAAAAGWDM
jgi:hypothetical protein